MYWHIIWHQLKVPLQQVMIPVCDGILEQFRNVTDAEVLLYSRLDQTFLLCR